MSSYIVLTAGQINVVNTENSFFDCIFGGPYIGVGAWGTGDRSPTFTTGG